MSPKQKALHILTKMNLAKDIVGKYTMCHNTAKECSLITVDEIIESFDQLVNPDPSVKFQIMWWKCVKDELNKM